MGHVFIFTEATSLKGNPVSDLIVTTYKHCLKKKLTSIWGKCFIYVKKLDGMHDHAVCIVSLQDSDQSLHVCIKISDLIGRNILHS